MRVFVCVSACVCACGVFGQMFLQGMSEMFNYLSSIRYNPAERLICRLMIDSPLGQTVIV